MVNMGPSSDPKRNGMHFLKRGCEIKKKIEKEEILA